MQQHAQQLCMNATAGSNETCCWTVCPCRAAHRVARKSAIVARSAALAGPSGAVHSAARAGAPASSMSGQVRRRRDADGRGRLQHRPRLQLHRRGLLRLRAACVQAALRVASATPNARHRRPAPPRCLLRHPKQYDMHLSYLSVALTHSSTHLGALRLARQKYGRHQGRTCGVQTEF